MTFVCPYCGQETRHNIGVHLKGFGRAKCKSCGRKYRYVPIAMKDEMEGSWKRCLNEAYGDHLIDGLIVVGIVSALFVVAVVVMKCSL